VDDVIAQQQVVIKPLGEGLENSEDFSGAAILSDGKASLILNVDRLISRAPRTAVRRARQQAALEARP
jgi:two-component system, chemotaxis family, sensor kinase CheA